MISLEDFWDEWIGQLALQGVDPRRFDLIQLLAAFEATMQQGCKDDADWQRTKSKLYAPPKEERQRQVQERREARTNPSRGRTAGRMTAEDAEAMLARMAISDAAYGAA